MELQTSRDLEAFVSARAQSRCDIGPWRFVWASSAVPFVNTLCLCGVHVDNLQVSVLSFFSICPWHQTQVIRFGSRCICLLSYLADPMRRLLLRGV